MANWISSSISIGSLNKHQLAEMLLTACNYYQLKYLKTCSKMSHMPEKERKKERKKCGKNAGERCTER